MPETPSATRPDRLGLRNEQSASHVACATMQLFYYQENVVLGGGVPMCHPPLRTGAALRSCSREVQTLRGFVKREEQDEEVRLLSNVDRLAWARQLVMVGLQWWGSTVWLHSSPYCLTVPTLKL